MAKQTATPTQTAATPLASGSATASEGDSAKNRTHQTVAGDRIADELVEAIELGIDADNYCAARGAGATHAECLTVWKDQSRGFPYYVEARQAGATHAEVMEVLDRRANLYHYAWASRVGATHAEVMEVLDRRVDLYDYVQARQAGATHAECMEALDSKASLWGYSRALYGGCTHSEALERERQ